MSFLRNIFFIFAYYFLGDDFMNCKIPFTKDILFEKKVSEITSISLEHEITTEEGMLKGNFIVSGDFKSHEVSVNKEPFSYILPFEIELMEDIDTSTIEFMIDDFTYEVVDQSILRVNIDFNVVADKKPEQPVEEESIFRDASDLFLKEEDQPVMFDLDEMIDSSKEEAKDAKEVEESKDEEEEIKEDSELLEERNIMVAEEVKEESNEKQTKVEETIINSAQNQSDDYATYHIHMVSDGETVETICTMYNSNLNILSDYNDLSDINSGDKLIIPEKNE